MYNKGSHGWNVSTAGSWEISVRELILPKGIMNGNEISHFMKILNQEFVKTQKVKLGHNEDLPYLVGVLSHWFKYVYNVKTNVKA